MEYARRVNFLKDAKRKCFGNRLDFIGSNGFSRTGTGLLGLIQLVWPIPYGTASDLSEIRTPNNPSQADRSLKILNLELNIEVNTNQKTSTDRDQSQASFHEDLLSKIEELKTNDVENEESSDSEEFMKTKLLENLQEVLLKHNRKSDFIFMLLLQSMITKVFPLPVSFDNFRF